VSLGLEKILGYANATSFSVKRSTDSSFIWVMFGRKWLNVIYE
jgi:hypothetical protein